MWIPLAVLAVLSIIGGWIGWPAALGGANHFEHFLEPAIAHVQPATADASSSDPEALARHSGTGDIHGATPTEPVTTAPAHAEEQHDVGTERLLTGISVLLGLLGIGIGFALFRRQPLRQMPKLLEDKYKVDELYDAALVSPLEQTSRHLLWQVVDVKIIDGFVNGAARLMAGLAGVLRYTQTGMARSYAAVILLGAIVVIGYFGYIALR